jgi:hypothetical protein
MRRLFLISLAILALYCASATAQNAGGAAQQASWKAVTLIGTISLDAKTLVTDEDDTWTITNSDVLKGREGQHFVLKCRADQAKHAIHVLLVKPDATGMKQAANSGDSAFRR